ncbi:eukaryotic translation initiation factor 4B2-like [Tasmannia lanceolata]|uniref:eukaryotic translation initiation factor 4B2-like n=1 Tax=Tasmannia lanceolata TaxID=3420 RepID=UPI004063B482
MSKTWGVGAWAADAERAEAEEREHQLAAAAASQLTGGESQSFPSLKEAATTKPKKKKAVTLSELTTGFYVGPGGGSRRDFSSESKGLTPNEMLRLPTGPKERSPDEIESGTRLGGGFRSYGRPGPMRSDDSGRRGYGGFDEERPPRVSEFDQPSRADVADNWASVKKSVPVVDFTRHDRYSSLGGGTGINSRADVADNWASDKKSVPVPGPSLHSNRYASLGGGIGSNSRADVADNWVAGKKPIPARSTGFGSGFRDSAPDSNHGRPRIVLDPPRSDGILNEVARTRPSPFGVARPREDVLAEKGLDWRKLDSEIDIRKTSRPMSTQPSIPSSAQSSRPESPLVMDGVAKPQPKLNPFGDAKPREVLLQEQGKDWRKIDLELEHRSVDRPETEEEKTLKEEIELLKKEFMNEAEVNVNEESTTGPSGENLSLREQILHKERDLELLVRELDDKIRFGQRAIGSPSSGARRVVGLLERPPSQSGLSEESRRMEFMDRPRSHGAGDVWTRSGEDKGVFQGGRERGFFGNRDLDRPKSRERW